MCSSNLIVRCYIDEIDHLSLFTPTIQVIDTSEVSGISQELEMQTVQEQLGSPLPYESPVDAQDVPVYDTRHSITRRFCIGRQSLSVYSDE